METEVIKKKYRATVTYRTVEIHEVEAEDKEEATKLIQEGEGTFIADMPEDYVILSIREIN